jgi:leucine-rich repeat protein SHOC2
LYLDYNQLTALPAEIGNLTNLTTLYLRVNQLTTLPAEIKKLPKLTDLRYDHEKIDGGIK